MLGIYEDWGSELVNTTDSTHNTPLHIAAKKGNINSLRVRRERERETERVREKVKRGQKENKKEITHLHMYYMYRCCYEPLI